MIPALLLGLAAAAVIVACWDEIVSWLKEFIPKVKAAFIQLGRGIAHAAAVFLQKVGGAMANVSHRSYYKNNNKWIEKSTVREIEANELPPSIKRKLSHSERDITPEIEDELDMTVQ